MKPIFKKGQLITWKDDKGFGFIRSDSGGPDVFLHISVLPQDSRRPKIGDTILYQRVNTPKGKVRAAKAAIQGVTSKLQIDRRQTFQKNKKNRNNRTAKTPITRVSSNSQTSNRKPLRKYQLTEILVGLAALLLLTLTTTKNIFHKSPQTVTSSSPKPVAATLNSECKIKGNISISTDKKLYHVPGMEDYSSTNISPEYGERWFCSEAEAIENGWRKAPR
ncbi:MAG: cold shock domain-containing protein [Cyanobacteria bacterium P01_B01_bin.77]